MHKYFLMIQSVLFSLLSSKLYASEHNISNKAKNEATTSICQTTNQTTSKTSKIKILPPLFQAHPQREKFRPTKKERIHFFFQNWRAIGQMRKHMDTACFFPAVPKKKTETTRKELKPIWNISTRLKAKSYPRKLPPIQ